MKQLKKSRFWIMFALVFTSLFYFINMIPKLGPIVDLDLFWTVYFVFAFLFGLIFENLNITDVLKRKILLLYIGSSLFTANALIFSNLQWAFSS
jgi:hypothetical protein